MTSEIKTTDCYLPVEMDNPKGDYVWFIEGNDNDNKSIAIELYSGMIVLTKEQFEKIVGESFDAGSERMYNETRKHLIINTPDKTEYIATLFKTQTNG